MSILQPQNSDLLTSLPVDKIQPSHEEIQIVDTLFKNHSSTMNTIFNEAKESLIVGILFILFSMPQVDELLQRFIPITATSFYFLILIKAALVMVAFWLIKYFYLSKNK
jgi:hypothetical protein